MIVTNPAVSTYAAQDASPRYSGTAVSSTAGSVSQSSDIVQFSSSGLAASGGAKLSAKNPAVYTNSVKMQISLDRIFMETLFGKDETAEESATEELVRTVVEEPVAAAALDKLMEQSV